MPPPYVPVLLAAGVLVGAGLLQLSLGDIISDEANLGDRSGARAKKEMERGRNSFFRNK